ncbi:MAG: DsbA family protein, partial [Alphaproteobacteria bacterium]|nr:DsbA family protein [Alphaproteobacteria bacterium]
VVLAAQEQGMDKAQKLHERLMKATAISQRLVLKIAEEVGLNAKRLEVDMKLPQIKAQLAEIHALAKRLQFTGVPGLVVGNRVANGAPGRAGLDRYVQRIDLEQDRRDLVLGNPKGSITLVEFTDYLCQECRRFESELKELIKSDSRIRLVVKQNPKSGDNSVFAASVVLAAQAQGMDRVQRLHEQLLQSTDALLQQQTVLEAAKQVGLDIKRLEADLKLPQIKTQLAETSALAKVFLFRDAIGIVIGNTSGSQGGFRGAYLQNTIAEEAKRIASIKVE